MEGGRLLLRLGADSPGGFPDARFERAGNANWVAVDGAECSLASAASQNSRSRPPGRPASFQSKYAVRAMSPCNGGVVLLWVACMVSQSDGWGPCWVKRRTFSGGASPTSGLLADRRAASLRERSVKTGSRGAALLQSDAKQSRQRRIRCLSPREADGFGVKTGAVPSAGEADGERRRGSSEPRTGGALGPADATRIEG